MNKEKRSKSWMVWGALLLLSWYTSDPSSGIMFNILGDAYGNVILPITKVMTMIWFAYHLLPIMGDIIDYLPTIPGRLISQRDRSAIRDLTGVLLTYEQFKEIDSITDQLDFIKITNGMKDDIVSRYSEAKYQRFIDLIGELDRK